MEANKRWCLLLACLLLLQSVSARSLFSSGLALLSGNPDRGGWTSNSLSGSTKRPLVWQPATNSPIYYIKLAPSAAKSQIQTAQGLGYVSRPLSATNTKPFFSVPFKANGRPSSVYTLSSSDSGHEVTSKPQTIKPTNSPIRWLPGSFSFDGKPSSSVSVLKPPFYQSLLAKLLALTSSPSASRHPSSHSGSTTTTTTTTSSSSGSNSSSSSSGSSGSGNRRNSKFDMFMWGSSKQ